MSEGCGEKSPESNRKVSCLTIYTLLSRWKSIVVSTITPSPFESFSQLWIDFRGYTPGTVGLSTSVLAEFLRRVEVALPVTTQRLVSALRLATRWMMSNGAMTCRNIKIVAVG